MKKEFPKVVSKRLQRLLLKLLPYNIELRYRPYRGHKKRRLYFTKVGTGGYWEEVIR